jgi:hypothetical protein
LWTRVATRVTSQHSSGVRATMEDDVHKVDAVEQLSDVGTDGSSDVSWGGGGDSDAFWHCNSPRELVLYLVHFSLMPQRPNLTACVVPFCLLLCAECCVLL